MFGIGETELLIIVAFGFMIFGPDKLPGMGRTIGRALRQFREAQEGFTQVVQTEVMDPLQDAMGDPLESGTRQKRRATAEERAAALAADADLDADTEDGGQQHAETFAERKARLAAERKAREQAPVADAPAPEAAPAAEAVPEPEAPSTSAAALYALDGGSSFAAAKRQAAEEAAAAQQDASASADADSAATSGKEDGTSEA